MDDVVCIWKHSLDSSDLFHKHLNSFDKNTKFTVAFEDIDKLSFFISFLHLTKFTVEFEENDKQPFFLIFFFLMV